MAHDPTHRTPTQTVEALWELPGISRTDVQGPWTLLWRYRQVAPSTDLSVAELANCRRELHRSS